MPVDSITNSATFNMFVQFATRADVGAKSVAMISTDALSGRKIEANLDDSVGKLFRGDQAKTMNNDVRALFKSAVEEMFGGAQHVPENVRKMMLEGDYNKGKPLTARRIIAVKNAIEVAQSDHDSLVNKAKAELAKDTKFKNLSPQDKEALAKSIGAAVKSCMANKAALDSVMKNMAFIVMDGARNIRSPESVADKCNALLANFQELGELSKGNKAFEASGKALMDELHGKSLPPGVIGNIVRAVKDVDVSVITKLSKSSSAMEFDAAVKQFREGIQKAMVGSGAEKTLTDGDELEPCRDFVAALIVGKCGSSGLSKLSRALNSETPSKLMSFYNVIQDGDFDKDNLTIGHIEAAKVDATARVKFLNALKFAVDIACGAELSQAGAVPAFDGDLDYGKMNAGVMLKDILDAGEAQALRERDTFIDIVVQGKGTGAAALRGIYEDYLGPTPLGPADIVNTSASRVAKGMMGVTVIGECHTLAVGGKSTFEKDVPRQTVKLSNGVTLAKTFKEARDQLTQFVTGDPNAKYENLTDAKLKNKVHIAMALLSQESEKAVYDGYPVALDPKGKDMKFVVMDGAERTSELNLSIDSEGGFELTVSGQRDIAVYKDDKGTHMTGEGSKLEAKLSYVIYGSEVDRLASLDFSKVDDTEVRKTLDDKTLDHKFELAPKQFAKEFQIDESKTICKPQMRATFN